MACLTASPSPLLASRSKPLARAGARANRLACAAVKVCFHRRSCQRRAAWAAPGLVCRAAPPYASLSGRAPLRSFTRGVHTAAVQVGDMLPDVMVAEGSANFGEVSKVCKAPAGPCARVSALCPRLTPEAGLHSLPLRGQARHSVRGAGRVHAHVLQGSQQPRTRVSGAEATPHPRGPACLPRRWVRADAAALARRRTCRATCLWPRS